MGTPQPEVTLSIVSHGQGHLVRDFLEDLSAGIDVSYDVILTLNVPEDERFLDDFRSMPIKIVRNQQRQGFGANHNAAFALATGVVFAVVNPDIRAAPLRLQPLLDVLKDASVAACAPAVYAPGGQLEDSARRFPSVRRLSRRVLLRDRRPEYRWESSTPFEVDWVAGMFVLFRREAFARVGGFDERFFMYFEDVDICRRMHSFGWRVLMVPQAAVVHNAQRASRRSLTHLSWHIASALRYLAWPERRSR